MFVLSIVDEYIEAAERDRNRAALKILKNDYARRLDRAELIGLLMRDRLEDSARPRSVHSDSFSRGAPVSWPAPIFSFHPLRTSR